MKNIIYLMLLLFVACVSEPSDDKKMDIREVAEPNIAFEFKTIGEPDSNKMKKVTGIQVLKKGQIHQTLEGFESDVQQNEDVIVEDLNFDGYPDIRLLQYLPATPNIPYYYWLYDTALGKYVRNVEMEKITSPALDMTNQSILSQWSKSRTLVGTDYYQFKGHQLKLIKQEVQEYTDPNTYVLTVKKPMGDSLQVVKKELIKE